MPKHEAMGIMWMYVSVDVQTNPVTSWHTVGSTHLRYTQLHKEAYGWSYDCKYF